MTTKCVWTESSTMDWTVWDTSCDNAFQFEADGPQENSFKFCPYCGGELEAVPQNFCLSCSCPINQGENFCEECAEVNEGKQ